MLLGVVLVTALLTAGVAAPAETVAFDGANSRSVSSRALTRDNAPPALSVTGPSNRSFTPGAALSWRLNARDASGIAAVQCGVVAKTAMPSFGPCSGGARSHATRIETPGRYAFFVRATDGAGNVRTAKPLEFTIAAPGEPPQGAARAFLPIVRNSFRTIRGRTRFLALNVSNLPAGSRAELSCRGPGCAFSRKRFAPRMGRIALLPALRGRPLRTGARLAVRVVGPSGEVKLVRFAIRRGKPPAKLVRCAPAGGGRLGRCA